MSGTEESSANEKNYWFLGGDVSKTPCAKPALKGGLIGIPIGFVGGYLYTKNFGKAANAGMSTFMFLSTANWLVCTHRVWKEKRQRLSHSILWEPIDTTKDEYILPASLRRNPKKLSSDMESTEKIESTKNG